jgi:hypothetical protein
MEVAIPTLEPIFQLLLAATNIKLIGMTTNSLVNCAIPLALATIDTQTTSYPVSWPAVALFRLQKVARFDADHCFRRKICLKELMNIREAMVCHLQTQPPQSILSSQLL